MKKLAIFCALLLCIALNVNSQENYIPGSILTLNHDTLKGLVDYRDWELNPEKIRYKDPSGEIKTFRPKEITGFFINQDIIFLSKHLAMDVSNYRVEDLVKNDSVMIVRDTAVFVRLLVNGPMYLYYFKDVQDKEHFWFQNNNDSIFEMRITRKIVKTQGTNVFSWRSLATLNLYQVILPGIVASCPDMVEKVKTTSFSMNDFRKVAEKYNECVTGNKTVSGIKTTKVKCTFGLIAGASIVTLKFFGSGEVPITKAVFPLEWTYMGGVVFKIILPYLKGSWIIYNDLVYRPYHVKGTYEEYNIFNPGAINYYTYDFTMGYLKLNTLLRYQFPKWVVKPFINAGMSNSYALVNKNSYSKLTTSKPDPIYIEGSALKSTRSYEVGFVGGIGLCFKGLGLEFRYEWANAMSASSSITGSENSYSFLLSYTFGQK